MRINMLPIVRTATLMAAALFIGTGASAYGQEAFGVAGPPEGVWPIVQQIPLSKTYGTGAPGVVPVLKLDALNNTDLANQADAAAVNAPGKPRQIGVTRVIGLDASMGVWQEAPNGGHLWTLDVSSVNAVAMRIHFVDINLPEGASLVAYSLSDITQFGGPYTDRGDFKNGDNYTPVLAGDRARIEFYLPPGAAAGQLPFDADNVQHLFRDPMQTLTQPGTPRDGDPTITPTVGTCHNDVTCYPAWANVAKAVGMYVFTSGGGSYQCTGQLIATSTNDLTPYFITAAHCISTNTDAATVQVYWLFQTATCNGAAPNQASSPTTTGATLVATRAASDGTLLRLTGALPGGLYWVGWNSAAITNGAAVVGIHHPSGSWKRISFATATDAAGCTLGTQAETIDAHWTSGVTEGGSSGSGMFRVDTQQIVGTLSCGPSVCGTTDANMHDGYGRFASFYPTISTYLAGGSDDSFEPDNTCSAARQLSPVTNTALSNPGLVVKLTDEDWYKYTLPIGTTLTVTLTYTAANGTVNGDLYTTCGGAVIASATGTGTKTLTYVNNSGVADEVYLRVYLTGTNPSNFYDMTTLVSQVPSNNACASAIRVNIGNYAGTTVNATNDGTSSCPTVTAARTRPDVWYTYTAPTAGTLTLDTCLTSPTDTVISVHSACPGTAANQISCNDDALTTGPCGANANNYTSYTTTTLTAGQTVYIRVGMYGATTAPFTLRVNFTPTNPAVNDSCAAATTVGVGTTNFNTSAASTDITTDAVCNYFSYNGIAMDVWYRYIAQCTGDLTVDTCGSSFDTKLAIYEGCPSANNLALDCNDDALPVCSSGSTLASRVSISATTGHVYLIRVGGYHTTSGIDTYGAGVLNIACTPVAPPCPADMGVQGGTAGQDGILDNNDFIVFIDYFFNSNPLADVGVQGGVAGSDGQFDNNDFVVFINEFFSGCP